MKKIHIVGLVVIGVCITILLSVMGSTGEYANLGLAKANPGKEFHVSGVWDKSAPIEYNPARDPNYFAFMLKDSLGNREKVVIRNEKPQDFEKSEKLVVVGKMEGDHFEASSVLMKCPSKYNNMEVKVKARADLSGR
jgi:cytochrome c-type biogenesis protein CcmE